MNTGEQNIQDAIKRLLMIDHEITVLKFKVEEAMPQVRKECYQHVRLLTQEHKAVLAKVRALQEAADDSWEDQRDQLERSLQALMRSLGSVGALVRGRLADKIYFTEVYPQRTHERKTRSKVGKPGLKVKISRRKRVKPVEKRREKDGHERSLS